MRNLWLLTILGMMVLYCGCHGDRPKMVAVSGQVLIDGQPMRHGSVQFIPKGSRISYGTLDNGGRFRLTCRDPNDGAVLGAHTVTVTGSEIFETTNFVTKTRWHAPKKYADPKMSGLKADISGPIDDITFNITWDGGKPFVETEKLSVEPNEAGKRIGK